MHAEIAKDLFAFFAELALRSLREILFKRRNFTGDIYLLHGYLPMNNRHWISDVLVGAGVGILAANLAYLTHQNKWGHKRKLPSGTVLLPTYGQRSLGLSMTIPIH